MSDSETTTTATTSTKPSDRPGELQTLWNDFMAQYTRGKAVLKNQEEALAPKVAEHTSVLQGLLDSPDDPNGLLRQQGISLGGMDPITFVPKSNISAAQMMGNISANKLSTESRYAPGWADQAFLDYSTPLVTGLEALRYKLPGITNSTVRTPEPSALDQAKDWASIAGDVWSVFGG